MERLSWPPGGRGLLGRHKCGVLGGGKDDERHLGDRLLVIESECVL